MSRCYRIKKKKVWQDDTRNLKSEGYQDEKKVVELKVRKVIRR